MMGTGWVGGVVVGTSPPPLPYGAAATGLNWEGSPPAPQTSGLAPHQHPALELPQRAAPACRARAGLAAGAAAAVSPEQGGEAAMPRGPARHRPAQSAGAWAAARGRTAER